MTFSELQILLDISKGNEVDVLEKHTKEIDIGYIFVDSEDGQCWLFDKNGKIADIKKITTLCEDYIKKDIKKIVIPKSVKSIGDWAFAYCRSLKSIEIPNSVKSIGDDVFLGCKSLKSVEIPESVKSIGDQTFSHCTSLTSIKIPSSVENIRDGIFWNCKSLKSIEIPDTVKSIGYGAFYDCTSLEEVIFKDKTIDEVKAMDGYPWGIEDEAIIKCS